METMEWYIQFLGNDRGVDCTAIHLLPVPGSYAEF